MVSFFCERTAEYALVPIVQRNLETRFGAAVPIFYWKTREGNRVSSEIHKNRKVRVLAMFARRPKLVDESRWLAGNVNVELMQFAHAAQAVGIPTIAGFPAVNSMFALYSNPRIFWFYLEASREDGFGFFVDISVTQPRPIDEDGTPLETLSAERIFEIVERRSDVLSWDEAMTHISELRLQHYRPDFLGFGWQQGYKPVYFLMPVTIE
ncbi:hypothetical protein [Burkholderia pyrrocinia]|uniref:hypothetical protein n=1 Tax=Burkholderia pyrrocinia TaxID=60550 RepID=UPI002AB25AC6|nr:hypothetical protein [Burkholderia pyrrocinia]